MERRQFIKASAGAATALSLAGCLGSFGGDDEGSDDDVVTIGSDIPYKPFEYRDENNDLVGFDVDIAEAVFQEEMGRDYEFQKTSWDTIIQSLNNGSFRVIMSAMTITPERAEEVDFSDPYFTAYQTVAVRVDGDIQSKEDLEGETVAVQKGTTGEAAAEELQEEFDGDLTIDSYDQINGAFQALNNKQAVAVINDNTVNAEFVNENDDIVFLEGEGVAEEEGKEDAPPYLTLTIEEYGIAFRQDDDEFREQVNEALQAVKDSDQYDEIYDEYFEG